MSLSMTRDEIIASLRALGVPLERAQLAADNNPLLVTLPETRQPRAVTGDVDVTGSWILHVGESLTCRIQFPPRTKKNSTFLGIRQSAAYVRFAGQVKAVALAAAVPLPLPDRAYNLAAEFFVDKKGELADLTGLLQGLCDALQDAGVVSDDWYFRKFDGSRIIFGDETPRVAAVITPIEDDSISVPRGTGANGS